MRERFAKSFLRRQCAQVFRSTRRDLRKRYTFPEPAELPSGIALLPPNTCRDRNRRRQNTHTDRRRLDRVRQRVGNSRLLYRAYSGCHKPARYE